MLLWLQAGPAGFEKSQQLHQEMAELEVGGGLRGTLRALALCCTGRQQELPV
jgi:hypothetical protein